MTLSWKTLVLGSSLAIAVPVGGFRGYMELVRAGVLRYNKYDRREKGELKVGGAAPDLELRMYDSAPLRLSELWASKPVFLVFGSCT